LDRGAAEKKYGFMLYQGGGAPGKVVRVVEIEGDKGYLDAEACAGLHVSNTSEIGLIKIIREERIQDGVSRLVFTAGEKAVEFVQEQEKILQASAATLRVSPSQLAETTARFFQEWKERGKRVSELEEILAGMYAKEVAANAAKGLPVRMVLDLDAELLQKVAVKLMQSKNIAAVLANKDGDVVAVVSHDLKGRYTAIKLLNDVFVRFGGSGGGSEAFARGRSVNPISF
jgi:alanyl-tRNA synthetase